jgi:hypothetical protein
MLAGNSIHRAGASAGIAAGLQAFGSPGYGLSILDEPGNPLTVEILEENGPNGWEKWFEVYFDFPTQLAGNARDGWVDETLKFSFRLQRSEDLQTWENDWLHRPASVAPDGGFRYRGRSKYPVRSMVKTGQMVAGDTNGDARSQPFTGITINGVVQSLPNFPYHMPEDAAQLQTDLRAAGWTGATVSASAATTWSITVPNVQFTSYESANWVSWPMYLVPNMFGEVVNPCWGTPFSGTFVNDAGVRTDVPKQFARLQITTRSPQ